jgi:hypothetical protein
MFLPLNSQLPQNSADAPSARQVAVRHWETARVAASIVKARAASGCMASASSFAGVSPLAPTVVAEAQAVAANAAGVRNMNLAPAVTQQGASGAVVSDEQIAAAPTVLPMNAYQETPVGTPRPPRTPARRHAGVVWASPVQVAEVGRCPSAPQTGRTDWGKIFLIGAAVAAGVWALSE